MIAAQEIVDIVMHIGLQNLPTVTVCACLWMMVKQRDDGQK